MKISYNWLKSYIPEIVEAEKLSDIFTYHLTEVEGIEKKEDGDVIFDLNILPNRAHDLLSHHGVARELAGQLGIVFKDPSSMYKVPESKPTKLQIDIQTNSCRRYSARIIRNVKVGPSPEWVKNYLESIGQRSINNIVDATNIAMYDCGQPCHAFDLDKLASEKIIIRQATEGESIMTLSGTEVKLLASDMVIADEKNALAIAGVKGGKSTEVDENTKNILIEVANFDPIVVRKTSRRLGILTDSSKRFENDLSSELCDFAMKELSGLLVEYGAIEFEEIVDIYPKKQEQRKISFTAEFVNKKLGSQISGDEMENILKRYGYIYTRQNPPEKGDTGGLFEIIAPVLRLDLNIPEDIVEEIGRVYGYEKIAPVIPKINFTPKINETFYKTLIVRNKLLEDGYREVMTYAFTNKGDVEVLASASDKKFLRTNLGDGLKDSITLNNRNALMFGLDSMKVFEIGSVFKKDKEEINIAYGDKKSVVEMTLDEYCEKNGITTPHEDLSRVFSREEDTGGLFKMWSLYPFISRDISVWVPGEVESHQVHKVIKENAGELLIGDPRLVDTYKKEDKISYAFRLIFQSLDRTLTDEEVNKVMENISTEIAKNTDWKIR